MRCRWMFVAAAGLFLGGSIGIEMVEATLDFAGMTVFVYALLSYMVNERVSLMVECHPEGRVGQPPA